MMSQNLLVFWNGCVNGAFPEKKTKRRCLCEQRIFEFTGKVVPVILWQFTGIYCVKGAINDCLLSYFEGTANIHCYTSCTLTTLHCSKVSFLQCCHMKRYNIANRPKNRDMNFCLYRPACVCVCACACVRVRVRARARACVCKGLFIPLVMDTALLCNVKVLYRTQSLSSPERKPESAGGDGCSLLIIPPVIFQYEPDRIRCSVLLWIQRDYWAPAFYRISI